MLDYCFTIGKWAMLQFTINSADTLFIENKLSLSLINLSSLFKTYPSLLQQTQVKSSNLKLIDCLLSHE